MQRLARLEVGTANQLDEESFEDLIIGLAQPGYRLAWALLRDGDAAKDVVQDASVIAWRKMGGLGDRGRFRSWFLGIVANECRNARRKVARVHVGLPSDVAQASHEDRAVDRADLRRALQQLGYEDRLVVVLSFYLDLPIAEVAKIAGTSEGAARVRLHRAVRRLRPNVAMEEDLT